MPPEPAQTSGNTTEAAKAQTTTANLEARLKGIMLESLPKNFQEAIEITRALKKQYLWYDITHFSLPHIATKLRSIRIDSLCIVQDDKHDWEVESSNMANIYRNAYLVLGANCAASSSEGFLACPQQSNSHQLIAEIENSNGSVAKVYARDSHPHRDVVGPRSYYTRQGPLMSRGWAMQEQLLSRRMVHFEMDEIFWECGEIMSCECLELENGNYYKSTLIRDIQNGKIASWHAFANQYHIRSITYASDFLPALSGIVTYFQGLGAGPNLAGLWKDQLLGELLWEAGPHWMTWKRATPYRAPSWSWASLHEATKDHSYNGVRLSFWADDYGDPIPCSAILEATTTAAGVDPNGAVSGGRLVIKGKLILLHEIKPTGKLYPHGERYLQFSRAVEPDTTYTPLGKMTCSVDLTEENYGRMVLFGILLGYWPKGSQSSNSIYNMKLSRYERWVGLILRPVHGKGEKIYERVGVWNITGSIMDWDREELQGEGVEVEDFFNEVVEQKIVVI